MNASSAPTLSLFLFLSVLSCTTRRPSFACQGNYRHKNDIKVNPSLEMYTPPPPHTVICTRKTWYKGEGNQTLGVEFSVAVVPRIVQISGYSLSNCPTDKLIILTLFFVYFQFLNTVIKMWVGNMSQYNVAQSVVTLWLMLYLYYYALYYICFGFMLPLILMLFIIINWWAHKQINLIKNHK